MNNEWAWLSWVMIEWETKLKRNSMRWRRWFPPFVFIEMTRPLRKRRSRKPAPVNPLSGQMNRQQPVSLFYTSTVEIVWKIIWKNFTRLVWLIGGNTFSLWLFGGKPHKFHSCEVIGGFFIWITNDWLFGEIHPFSIFLLIGGNVHFHPFGPNWLIGGKWRNFIGLGDVDYLVENGSISAE